MADDTSSTAQSEAQRMLDTFASVGVTQFDIAHTNIDQEKRGYRRAQTLRQAKTSMPYLLNSAPRRQNNVILRPHHPPAVVLVQLDDLQDAQLELVRPVAFLILQTSPSKGFFAYPRKNHHSRLRRGIAEDVQNPTLSGQEEIYLVADDS
jgi:hypothetical protein